MSFAICLAVIADSVDIVRQCLIFMQCVSTHPILFFASYDMPLSKTTPPKVV